MFTAINVIEISFVIDTKNKVLKTKIIIFKYRCFHKKAYLQYSAIITYVNF